MNLSSCCWVETETVAVAGARMPAEWEPHASTWLAWPHHRSDWPGKFEPIPWVYAEIIRHLARHERVNLIVNDAKSERRAREILDRAQALSSQVDFYRWPTDRAWMRDSGCTFIKKSDPALAVASARAQSRLPAASGEENKEVLAPPGQLVAVKWRFTAWAKYPNWKQDEKIGSRMAKAAGATGIRPRFAKQEVVLEGGAIDVNGQGTLLTTEECLLSTEQQRNPGMGREDYENVFHEYLGIRTVIWLSRGIAGDDTHGHVDDLARFVAPDTVVCAIEPNPKDPNHSPLQENLRLLRAALDQDGKPVQVIELPMPKPVIFKGYRLPASYLNFYIANGLVLVPVFNDRNDRIALNILSDLFTDREVIGIYSGDLIWGLGALHCMTQQQPA